jgi:hypothetical protein
MYLVCFEVGQPLCHVPPRNPCVVLSNFCLACVYLYWFIAAYINRQKKLQYMPNIWWLQGCNPLILSIVFLVQLTDQAAKHAGWVAKYWALCKWIWMWDIYWLQVFWMALGMIGFSGDFRPSVLTQTSSFVCRLYFTWDNFSKAKRIPGWPTRIFL